MKTKCLGGNRNLGSYMEMSLVKDIEEKLRMNGEELVRILNQKGKREARKFLDELGEYERRALFHHSEYGWRVKVAYFTG